VKCSSVFVNFGASPVSEVGTSSSCPKFSGFSSAMGASSNWGSSSLGCNRYLTDGTCILEIEETFKEDEGEYICQATNPLGTVRTSADLTLKGMCNFSIYKILKLININWSKLSTIPTKNNLNSMSKLSTIPTKNNQSQ
jgi:hypothetical protein